MTSQAYASAVSTPLNPTTFVIHTVGALWENLPVILLGGLAFSLVCVPAFLLFVAGWVVPALFCVALLVAPAWSALMRMQATLLAGKVTGVAEMGHAFLHHWRPSFRLGVIGIIPCYLLYRLLPLVVAPQSGWGLWVIFAVTLFITAFIFALYLYAFPLVVLTDLPWSAIVGHSALLASRHAGNTIGLLSMGVLFALATIYLSLGLLFILPTIYALFVVNHCRMVAGEDDNQI